MHHYIFCSNDSYQIWIWLSVRNWNLDTSITATLANFVSSLSFSGFCVLELSLIQHNRRVHKYLRHKIWTKSIWYRLPVRSLSPEVFLPEDLKIQTIGLSIFTASDSGVQSRPLIWIFLLRCLGLCKGVWGELHSSKHRLSQYLSEQWSNINICIGRLAPPCIQQRQVFLLLSIDFS